ncbi:MAG: hypothetical protein WBQ95_19050 [Terracidiphilus sp.]
MTSRSYEVSAANVAGLTKAKLSLTNGMSALCVATIARRTIALDTEGALYLTEDRGKHWAAGSEAVEWPCGLGSKSSCGYSNRSVTGSSDRAL